MLLSVEVFIKVQRLKSDTVFLSLPWSKGRNVDFQSFQREFSKSDILYSFHLPGRVWLILSINTQLFLTGAILFHVQTTHLEMTLSNYESNANTVEPPQKSQKKVAVVERWPL